MTATSSTGSAANGETATARNGGVGRPRRESEDRLYTGLRIDRDLHARLHEAANERDVSVNWLVCRLVAEGLDRLLPLDEVRLTRDGADHV